MAGSTPVQRNQLAALPAKFITAQVAYRWVGMRAHVLKVQRHLIQPCVYFDAIRGPFKGLRWVDFNALVRGGSMTIGSRVTLRHQVHTLVTSKSSRNIRLVIHNTSSQAV